MLDVVAFLELLQSTYKSSPDHFNLARVLFTRFIHHRAFEKINARIKFRSKLWDDEPFALLATQTPSTIEPVTIRLAFFSPPPPHGGTLL